MCTGLEAAAIVSAIASTASAAGAIDQGQREAQIARANASMAEQQAEDANRRGGIEEEKQLAKVRQIRAQQAAIMGASNLDITTGTPAAVLDQTTTMGTDDAITIRTNAAREAFGYSMESSNYRARAGMATASANAGAFSTLLAGGARAYGVYKGGK